MVKVFFYVNTKILPEIEIHGFDVSKYAIRNSKKEIKPFLFNARQRMVLIIINFILILQFAQVCYIILH